MSGNCCDCCENLLSLGCLSSCGGLLDIGVEVLDAGVYVLKTNFGRRAIILESEPLSLGENVVFDISCLNENYDFTGKIFFKEELIGKIETQSRCIMQSDVVFDCVSFSTMVGEANTNTPPPKLEFTQCPHKR